MMCLLMIQKTCTFPLLPLSQLIQKNKMCQNNKTPNVKHKSRKSSAKKISSATVSKKSRTKTRKPKYLSLKLQLSTKTQKPITQKQQLNLFPLHPEKDQPHMQEHDQANDDVAFLLDTDNSTTNLHDLLDTATATSEEDQKGLVAATYYGGGDGLLEKAAMRSKERVASEERWVSYYDVVEEVSSCSGGTTTAAVEVEERKRLVGLKLDYEEILNAWCDKGPLYVEGESPQTVPDFHASSNALGEEWGSVGNLWQVPEVGSGTLMDKVGAKEGWKLGVREASVLRYKEKRQNRLFSKRIRYEVRKLNAEKRPRLKGRFVKRDTDE